MLILSVFLFLGCDNHRNKEKATPSMNDSLININEHNKVYKSIRFVDSFLNKNNVEIKKNTALKEHYEGLCTKLILPLIDKNGVYDDLPFKLVMTTIHNGTCYGNFIYDDEKHYVKVTCIIKKRQLESLKEQSKYFIKFKTKQFENGVSFDNEFSKIELPTVNGYLTSFKQY